MKTCPKCKREYDNSDYKYCPICSTKLEEDKVFVFVMGLAERLSDKQRKVCRTCGELFIEEDYKYCPFCSNELESEKIFTVDTEKRIITGKWNDDLIIMPFEEIYNQFMTETHPFSVPTFIEVFESKLEWDKKLEHDLKNTDEMIAKLTFNEVHELCIAELWARYDFNEVMSFKTAKMIKKEFNISHIPDFLPEKNICFHEIRKGKLYCLVKGNDRTLTCFIDDG